MHNEYITTCCILNGRDKLLLLKYADTDITKVSPILQKITLDLMDQCYKHVEEYHNVSKQKNKKYSKIEPLVIEQMKDMLFIKKKFIEYFAKPGPKTKEDLFTYIFAFQITANYFNQYLYEALMKALRADFTPDFWNKYDLNEFQLSTLDFADFYILRDREDINTGEVNLDLKKPVDIIDNYVYVSNKISEKIPNKLDLIKSIGNTMDNYYNADFPPLNTPYKDTIVELVDHIKVARNLQKPKQYIKRI